jgi:hypothetical protein
VEIHRSRFVVRPSSSRLLKNFRTGVRVGLPLWGLTILVYLLREPAGNGIAMLVTAGLIVVGSVLFLHESEIVVDGERIAKRSMLGFWRRARFDDVGGVAFRSIGPKHVGIVYRKDGRCVFWIVSDVWDQAGLRSLVGLIGGDPVEHASTYNDINREFPGTFPRWIAFYERHPWWTLALSPFVILLLIVMGMLVVDFLGGLRPAL